MNSQGSAWGALVLDVHARPERTKSARLQAAIRDAIRTGRLAAGWRLPATRTLAEDLGWARNVVVGAYDQLVAEGYLVAEVGSGTRVALLDLPASDAAAPGTPTTRSVRYDLNPGPADLLAFPLRQWRQCLVETLSDLPAAELGYTDARGALALRVELAHYLGRVRGAAVVPDQMVITTGVTNALGLLVRALGASRPLVVAVEDPGATDQRRALVAAGMQVRPVPVDAEGLRVDQLDRLGQVDMVVVTPAHQYPLGAVLTPERRAALVAWAREVPGRLIVEDDYDAEFRFDRRPVGTLQGVAPDVVVLTSSVSKTLAPALRLGWLALPDSVAAPVIALATAEFVTPDAVSQHALARLLSSCRYERIVRTRRRDYQDRRRRLVAAIEALPGCQVVGAAGGLHLAVMLPPGVDDRAVSAALAQRSVVIPPLAEYRAVPGPPGLVASYANLLADDVVAVAGHLAAVLCDHGVGAG